MSKNCRKSSIKKLFVQIFFICLHISKIFIIFAPELKKIFVIFLSKGLA